VNIVVARTVHDEEFALQALGEIDWRSETIAFSVVRGQTHVSFLINIVVGKLIGDSSDSNFASCDERDGE